jgi:AcrR family transcriptional regulator
MPTPAHTSLEAIVRAGREILETEGLAGLTMARVADAVGVRAPSLYKRVRNRGELVRLIGSDVARELGQTLEAATPGADPKADLRSIAIAFRSFARARPQAYRLLFDPLPDDWRPDPDAGREAVEVLFRVLSGVVGPADVLPAARTLVAWAYGFVSMELADTFRMGGDVDEAFAFGIERLVGALVPAEAMHDQARFAAAKSVFPDPR